MFKLLFPVLKAVAIAVSYVAQVFYTISGYLLTAVGAVVEAIGKLVKWLSFGTVKAIQNAGSAIRQSGRETLAAAEDMKEFRRDLRDLSWDDAMARVADSANKAADALLGVPEGFKVALARFNASDARGVVPSAAAGMGASAGTRIENHVPVTIHVHANERTDVRSLVDQITREFRREAHRGGVTGLDLVIGAT